MDQLPTFFGLTVKEHLDYIKGLYQTFETQYIMVERLISRVQSAYDASLSDYEQTYTSLAKEAGFDPEEFTETVRLYGHYQALSENMERFFMEIQSMVNTYCKDFASSPLYPDYKELLDRIDHYQKLDNIVTPSNIGDLTPIDQYKAAKCHLILFPIETFEEELKKVDLVVQDIENRMTHTEQSKEILSVYTKFLQEYKEKIYPKDYLLNKSSILLIEWIQINLPNLNSPLLKDIHQLQNRLSKLESFKESLISKTVQLKNLAEIYTDNVIDSMKINWKAPKADCKMLLDFLKKNTYIDAPYINKFISGHFRFNGNSVSPKAVGGWHPGKDGNIIEIGDHLKIPGK